MRKFKHKNLKVVGTVNENDNHLHFQREGGNIIVNEALHMAFVEISNDWEEIIDAKYHILTFRSTPNNTFVDKPIVIETSKMETKSVIDEYTTSTIWEIHSIERLSDGEVFTVGDFMDYKGHTSIWENYKGCVILGFSKYNGKLYINQHYTGGHNYTIEDWILTKPLFTTEDGVDIYKGDTFYWVSPHHSEPFKTDSAKSGTTPVDSKTLKKFLDEDIAREYIDMNNKDFSVTDILKAMGWKEDCQAVERLLNYKKNRDGGK